MSNTKNVTPGRIALAASAIAFVVYFLTMNRTFGFIDKGELVAVASTLGISHPTGYPTIMLLGYLFTMILPVRDVLALNILAALLTAASVGLLSLLFNELLARIGSVSTGREDRPKGKTKGSKKSPTASPVIGSILAGLAALGVGFTNTWWDQATGFEVYSLHAVMMPLVILLFLRYCDGERNLFRNSPDSGTEQKPAVGLFRFTRQGFWFAFALGISFTNHLTTVLLAPGLLVYYFWFAGDRAEGSGIGAAGGLRRLVVLIPPFLLGLLPYLWLLIRASMKPSFNWGDPSNLERLIAHITGKQYQGWFNSGGTVFSEQTSYFFGKLGPDFGYVGLALVLVGIVYLFGRQRRLAVMVSLLVITCVLWSGNYNISEIGPYYMTAILGLGTFAAVGLFYLYKTLGRIPAVVIGSLVVALTLTMNWSVSNESNTTMVEDMTRDVLENVPQNSLVLTGTWDNWVTGSFYLQGVEGVRSDVTVVDVELLRFPWYLDQLQRNHPELTVRTKSQLEELRIEDEKFERGVRSDSTTRQRVYAGMINALIDSNITQRPLFLGPELLDGLGARYTAVPIHLLFRLATDSTYLPEKFPAYHFTHRPGKIDRYIAELHQLYAQSAYDRATYEHTQGHTDLAIRYYNYALSFDPGYRPQDIPSLPLDGEKHVQEVIEFFEQLRSARGGQTR